MLITSTNNDKIKQVAKLVSSAAERRSCGLFVVEGIRLCRDAVLSGINPTELYITESAKIKYSTELDSIITASDTVYEISDSVAAKISDTKNPQGVFSVNKILDKTENSVRIENTGLYVALDNIQNPDNLGAICRTAEAFGYNAVIVGGGCDIYNPKALRASMGAMFRLPVIRCTTLSELFKGCDTDIIATVPDSNAMKITEYKKSGGAILVIGNEGNGISDDVMSMCNCRLTIPMPGKAESLNAAAAATVCMWELCK